MEDDEEEAAFKNDAQAEPEPAKEVATETGPAKIVEVQP